MASRLAVSRSSCSRPGKVSSSTLSDPPVANCPNCKENAPVKLSQFKKIFVKERGAEIFSKTFCLPPSCESPILYTSASLFSRNLEAIWISTYSSMFLHLAKIGKGTMNKSGLCSRNCRELFNYYRLTFLNSKRRSAMNALRHWNLHKGYFAAGLGRKRVCCAFVFQLSKVKHHLTSHLCSTLAFNEQGGAGKL